jgi:hypothetical protein
MVKKFYKDLFIFGLSGLGGLILVYFAAWLSLWLGFAVFVWVVTQWNFPDFS